MIRPTSGSASTQALIKQFYPVWLMVLANEATAT